VAETPVATVPATSLVNTPTVAPTAAPTPALTPFAVEAVVELPNGYDFVQLERLSWGAVGGSDQNAVTLGWGLAYQDAGIEVCFASRPEMVIQHPDGSSDTVSTDIANPTTVQAGDWYVVPPSLGSNCRNNQRERSVSLSIVVYQDAPGPPAADMPAAVTYDYLTQAEAPGVPAGPVRLTLRRVVLAAGEALPLAAAGPTFFYVEAGTLMLANAQGDVTITHDIGATAETAPAGSASTLMVGDGAYLPLASGSTVSAAGDGPVSVLVGTVEPAE
jgi:hypothetical protein